MTSSSEGEILQSSQVIRDRWKIKQKLGGGGFGEIYEALDLQSHNERVAVKVESAKATKQVLKMEVAVLRRLQGKKHACKFYGCGRNDKYNYLVMSLQGKNLADLRRESPKQCFSVSTALRLASQILVAIREIHSIGFLHRDVKPSNFAMGRTASTMRVVYMLDFGLARLFLNARGEIRSPRLAAGFRGTVRYAAVSAHKNKEMGRQDDLWSLFYMLVEFLQGALPWRRIKDKDEVGRMKDEANIDQLLDGCPSELLEIPKHLKTLGYPDEPNYDLLERCLWNCMARLGINMDDPYDWELGYENISGRSKTASNTTTNGNASTRLRSHTTAVRDRAPDDKNRAMDTQAPITMGEDEDEQTGNYNFKFPPLASSIKSSQHDEQEKPKYKRQEFMRPKYGAVSFDVIDAVNARLAAASNNGQPKNGTTELFHRMRIETSVENDPKHRGTTREFVEATIEQPPAAQQPNGEIEKSRPNSKSNRSITLSIGKRYQNGVAKPITSTATSQAHADDEPNGKDQKNAQTIVSRWQDSFDDSVDEDGMDMGARSPLAVNRFARHKQIDALTDNNKFPQSPTMYGDMAATASPRSGRRLFPVSKSSQPLLNVTATISLNNKPNGTTQPPPPRFSIITQKEANGTPQPPPQSQFHSTPPASPKSPKASVSSSHSGGGGLISHFKSLVNTFNTASSNALDHVRKRSLSRGISLDEARQRQQHQKFFSINANNQTLSPNDRNGQISPNSTTPSSGIGTLPTESTRKLTREEEERELRRQRRLRRRSDCEQMLPTSGRADASPSAVHKTIVVRTPVAPTRYSSVVDNSADAIYDKSSSNASCRRKRYQFLHFAPRAMSRS